jgi:hypothetical protein
MSRRRFLKNITGMLVASAIPKVPEVKPEETKTHYAGKIKVGDMIAKVDGNERMRIGSNGSVYINYEK